MAFDDGLLDAQTVLYDTPKAYGDYAPGNFDRGHRGPVRAGVALQDSLNIPAVAVLSDLGPDLFQQAWGEAGMAMKLPKGADANLGLALGAVGTRLQDLVQAYGALVNDGYVVPLRLTQIDKRNSMVRGKAFLTSQSANDIKKILAAASPIQGRLSRSSLQGSRQASFKTGTSYGYRDSWAVGVKGEYVVGVWVGRPDGTPVVGQTGRTVALRLASDIADGLHVKGEIEPWAAEPMSPAALDRPAIRLIYPSDGTNIVLKTPPTLSRQVGIKLSGLSAQLEVFLNGNAVPSEHVQRGTLSVPTDGTYEIQIVESGKQVEKSMFSVISQF
jgi:penicillin-binding protein 1C